MTGFVLTHQALSDLKAIGIYTQNTWGKRQRDRYLTALDKAFHALATAILIPEKLTYNILMQNEETFYPQILYPLGYQGI